MALSWQSPVYLKRERLLELIPEEPGFVLWLEAPAGFGKSVLAGQLAERLSWRVVWGSALLGDLKGLLAKALNLPPEAPWGALVETLKLEPTLVVLEDLTGEEDLSPLLRTLPCLLILASRRPLPYPELPKLLAEGRLVHLQAGDLVFTQEEAHTLFGGRAGWEEAHAVTGGWPLPLFLSAFTGKPPETQALLRGLKESLSEGEFQEGLLLAALPVLPEPLARPETQSLFQKGLLRHLQEGFTLHPLLKEIALKSLLPEVQQAVRGAEGRLAEDLLAEAYWNARLPKELLALLEKPIQLRIPAERLVQWEALLRRGGMRARLRLGEALLQCGKREGYALLEPLAASQDPGVALTASGHLAYYLAEPLLGKDLKRARGYLERGLALLDQVNGELAGRFLNDAARVPYEEERTEEALRLLEEALRRLPPESPYRIAPLTNLAFLRFELKGALLERIAALEEAVLATGYSYANLPGHLRDLGRLYLLLGEREKATDRFRKASEAPGNPLAALEARIFLAYLTKDPETLARLLAQAELWENSYLVERGRAFLAELRSDPDLLAGLSGFLPGLARALLLNEASLLPPRPQEREEQLYWHAARYRILRKEEDLRALLALTDAREKVLPGLLPLALLPRKGPELAQAYPLWEVLQSGWKEAVASRLPEIPPLRVRVLGQFQVEGPVGAVELKGRAKELFALLLLGLPREEVAYALWPDLPEEAALNNLHVWLTRLRKVLEPWGVPTYCLEEGLVRVELDLFSVEEALEKGDAERVLALYQEPLFPGLDHPFLDRKREEVFHRVRALFVQKGEPRLLERLLELDPLDEEALVSLVEQCLHKGQKVRAKRLLEAYRKRLREELGERPSPALEALFRQL
ncbi:BTAD domain-containing putative transcriptional regulator [Meiothermus sp.]|uniref:BTAD domain-containing putative transcriptional regulator n=1 Tax=Meiothermus sp. TaxID=1955249 RepID=UPI0021DB9200|nr:BTAD domain-containing putative transcriptional regulator [Meiothermus sp.]GIW26621.1 MAG: transcriptional regulator [Meiothermus sp.]